MPPVHYNPTAKTFGAWISGVFTAIASRPLSEVSISTTGNIDNLDFSNASLVRMTGASDWTLRGLLAGYAGQIVTIVCQGAGNGYLAHENTNSSAANRLKNPATSTTTPLAAGVGVVQYQYDGTTQRWRLIQHDQGAAIAVAHAGGNFTASGSMTWTVESADQLSFSYLVRGRNVLLNINLDGTVVGGVASSALRVAFPNGITPDVTQVGPAVGADNGVASFINFRAPAASTFLEFRRTDGANWALSPVNGTNVIMNSEITIA